MSMVGNSVSTMTSNASGVVFENTKIISMDYTLPADKNAVSAGPVTINTGVVVTISPDSVWVVL